MATLTRSLEHGQREDDLSRWRSVNGAKAHASAGSGAIFIALMILSPEVAFGSARADPRRADSLAASVEVPWNPPRSMARRRAWEKVALLPGQVVSLPLSGLGYVTDNLLLLLEENPRFGRGLLPSPGSGGPSVAVRTPRMGDRAGLGAAVEARDDFLHGARKSWVAAELTGTLRGYNRTLLAWSGTPMSLQYGYEWRPQERFYGLGGGATEDQVSDYATQREFVRGGLGWQTDRKRDRTRPHTALGLWLGPRSEVIRTGREQGIASFETRFPALGAAMLDQRVEHLVYGASLLHDRRNGSPHWGGGWRTLLVAERFDAPIRAFALHSGEAQGAQFTRYQAEAEAAVSFRRDPRTLRLLVRTTDIRVSSGRERLLVSDLSTLGGRPGLGGYPAGRFHDLDLFLARLNYIFPLSRRLEMDLHSEWGDVYPDVWSDAKLDALHHSFGFAFRVRDQNVPRASIGLDFSREAIRLRYSVGGTE
jgi:hypothetical protein